MSNGHNMYVPQTSPHLGGAYNRAPTSPQRQPSLRHSASYSPQRDGQNSQQNQFALRPTHRTSMYTPHVPPAPSPLRPRSDNLQVDNTFYGAAGGRATSAPPDDVFYSPSPQKEKSLLVPKAKWNSRLRQSRSSEGLARIARDEERVQHSLTDDDDDERIRLPAGARAVGSAATTFSGPNTAELLVSEFPAPPNHHFSPHPSSSRESFVTAQQGRGSDSGHSSAHSGSGHSVQSASIHTPSGHSHTASGQGHTGHSTPSAGHDAHYAQQKQYSHNNTYSEPHPPVPPPVRLPPYAAEASPKAVKPRPMSEIIPTRHSHNQALLAAETGGMVGHDGGTFVQGRGPGEQIGAPRPQNGSVRGPRSQQAPPSPLARSPAATFPNQMGASAPAPAPAGTAPADRVQSTAPQQPQTQSQPRVTQYDYAQPQWEQPGQPGLLRPPQPERPRHKRSHSDGEALAALARQGTLFHPASSQERAAKELDVMLGKPRSRRLSANRLLPAPETPTKVKDKDQVRLEAAKKGRARVELDVVIERECVVEGGHIRGRLEVIVRGGKRGKGLRVGGGKLRVLGYEESDNGQHRHIFYQHQYPLRQFNDNLQSSLFTDEPDAEGFRAAKEGTHDIGFSMPLPVGGGAKGAYTAPGEKGPNIRYVVVGSIKLHIPSTGKRAIAHFYRPIVILPYFNPATALAPSRQPIVAHTTSGLGWRIGGEKGRVEMQVALGRRNWVAGQRVWCEVAVRNQSHKKINRMALAILQTVHVFGIPKGNQRSPPVDTFRTKVSEEAVEADFMDVGRGHVTSKSWWTGLESGESNRWDMSVPIPTGMLSIPRSRFLEVSYTLRVTLNNTIFVDVPLQLINFLSIDPPPMPSDTLRHQRVPLVTKPVGIQLEERSVAATSAASSVRPETALASSTMLGHDLNPRPPSPGSVYSRSAQSTLKRSEGHMSVFDEAERDYLAAEAARREGREQSLRAINVGAEETLLTDEEEEHEGKDERQSEHEHLSAEEQRTFAPNGALDEREIPIGYDADADTDATSEISDATITEIETLGPLDVPRELFSPVPDLPLFDIPDFTKHPRDEYLSHISEEEEPMDDDMLTEIVSLSGDRGGHHLHLQGEDDDFDDMMDDDDYDEAHTPRMGSMELAAPTTPTTPSRRSLDERLKGLCVEDKDNVEVPQAPSTYTVLPRSPTIPTSVDYAQPLDLDVDMMSTESHTTFGGPVYLDDWDAPQQERAFLSPPTLPSPQTARDIHWGGDLTGRTVSGHSVMPQFSDDDHQRLSHKSSLSTLREASEAEYSELSDDELQPPTALGRVDTPGSYGSHESFHTADGAGATSSDSDRGGATTPRQSLYNAPRQASPAPASPSLSHGNLKVAIPESAVPDRFRPRIVSEADSLASVDSMMSSTSTNLTNMTHESVLPSVAARVAQMESREKALRKFSVASSAGLVSSPPTHLVPLSPTSSGRVSPSGRKSYTSALGGPRPRSPMSPMSLHSNTMTIHSNTVSERSVSPASFDHSPVPTTTSLPSVDEHGTTQSAVSDGARKPYGLDAAALGGTAFARGITSPNSSLGHGHNRWSMGSVLSQDAHRMLNRALSTSSNSTTATDVDRALSPTRMGPRGPRAATRTVISPISTAPSLSAVVNKMPIMSAVTPTQQLNLNPLFRSVKSESAEFEDGEGYMSDTYSDIEGHEIVILSSNAQGLQPQVNSVRSMQTPALCKSGSMTSSDESEPKSTKSVYGRLQTLTTFSKIDSDKFDNIETASNSGSAESASTAPSATSNWSTGLKGVMNMNVRLPQFSMR